MNYSTNLSIGQEKEDFKNLNVNVDKIKYFLTQQKNAMSLKEKELIQKKIQMKEELNENIKSLKILSSYEK